MNTQTYAEAEGEKPFYWNKALANPPEIDSPRHEEMTNKAADLVTCACGNQCSALPRLIHGVPKDARLSDLGLDFSFEIEAANWPAARATLAKIEARSAELLADMKL